MNITIFISIIFLIIVVGFNATLPLTPTDPPTDLFVTVTMTTSISTSTPTTTNSNRQGINYYTTTGIVYNNIC